MVTERMQEMDMSNVSVTGLGGMIARMPSVQQRVALVTGSSRGLGGAIAQRLASDGLAIAVNGLRDDAQMLAVVDEIHGAGGIAAAFTG